MKQATITDDQESSAQVEVVLRRAKAKMKIGRGNEFKLYYWLSFIQYYILIHENVRFSIRQVSDIC